MAQRVLHGYGSRGTGPFQVIERQRKPLPFLIDRQTWQI